MTWDDGFMCLTGSTFSEMRLLVEGAIRLFEDDAGCLLRLARDAEKHEATCALNDIGTALYELRQHSVSIHEVLYGLSGRKKECVRAGKAVRAIKADGVQVLANVATPRDMKFAAHP